MCVFCVFVCICVFVCVCMRTCARVAHTHVQVGVEIGLVQTFPTGSKLQMLTGMHNIMRDAARKHIYRTLA